ncbi:hypothetical protein BGW36DRAFT_107534 [Talaromyces proteolyticus]|uniref:Uncharacterized protein n=1 Tax=Talaromyces proteolyticus TaxID=1131652 RepID=A0AAD4KYI3_9EURO|nr:uncharacterized protein BGW36DRAFT_107534 [Talaromyces proteolyticus]KAH8701882.1 hypothetical protein BGW36DRAFT_107534 [Talaromyces proteolyticus]
MVDRWIKLLFSEASTSVDVPTTVIMIRQDLLRRYEPQYGSIQNFPANTAQQYGPGVKWARELLLWGWWRETSDSPCCTPPMVAVVGRDGLESIGGIRRHSISSPLKFRFKSFISGNCFPYGQFTWNATEQHPYVIIMTGKRRQLSRKLCIYSNSIGRSMDNGQ